MTVPVLAFLATVPVSWLAVAAILRWLRYRQILDHPNERSSHTLPTPRGGGLAVTPVILVGWLILASIGAGLPGQASVVAGAAGLLALSWQDDRVSLSARLRLLLHLLAVIAGLAVLPADQLIFQGWLPWWADRLLAGIGWLWFVNLYNFMDGIDGLTGVESISLAGGLIAFQTAPAHAAVIAAALLGFLGWNWHRAKIFLGDSGSIPLGYLLGWLLLRLAADGHLAAALILPGYYLADATITLLRRAARRERIWQAHRQHFYQRAVQQGAGHDQVALVILAANVALIAVALWSQAAPWSALAAAAAIIAGLLRVLAQMGVRSQTDVTFGPAPGDDG